jgi:hypothetical protein
VKRREAVVEIRRLFDPADFDAGRDRERAKRLGEKLGRRSGAAR